MNFSSFLFTSKVPGVADPLWLTIAFLIVAIALLLLGMFGKKLVSKDHQKALHKTLKKSAFGLKVFGITFLLLIWVRLEALRFFSMKVWWLVAGLGLLWFVFAKWRYYISLERRIRRGL